MEEETTKALGASQGFNIGPKNTMLGSKQAELCRRYQPQNKQTNPKPEGQIRNNSQTRTSELLVARDAEKEKNREQDSTGRDGQGQKL